jgi:hypothetical protein
VHWPEMEFNMDNPEQLMLKVFEDHGYRYKDVTTSMENTLIIIDSAEKTATCTSLWEYFWHRINAKSGPYIVVFGTGMHIIGTYGCVQPLLPEANRFPTKSSEDPFVPGLYFNKQEFTAAACKECSKHRNTRLQFMPSENLLDILWYHSEGHPGVTSTIIRTLRTSDVCFPSAITQKSLMRFQLFLDLIHLSRASQFSTFQVGLSAHIVTVHAVAEKIPAVTKGVPVTNSCAAYTGFTCSDAPGRVGV